MLLSIFQVLAESGGQNGVLISNDVNMMNLRAEAVPVLAVVKQILVLLW